MVTGHEDTSEQMPDQRTTDPSRFNQPLLVKGTSKNPNRCNCRSGLLCPLGMSAKLLIFICRIRGQARSNRN